jgi:hypothetical protein
MTLLKKIIFARKFKTKNFLLLLVSSSLILVKFPAPVSAEDHHLEEIGRIKVELETGSANFYRLFVNF